MISQEGLEGETMRRQNILLASATLLVVSAQIACVSVPTQPGSATISPTSSSGPLTASPIAFSIIEPANGATVTEASIIVRGTADPQALVVHDIRFGPDEDAIADGNGEWQMALGLSVGPNQLRFRIGDDNSTEVDWIIVYTPEVAMLTASPPEATPTATASPTPTPTAPAGPTAPPTQTPAPTPTPTAKPTATPSPAPEYIEFDDDTYSVPDELPPGTYRTRDETYDCYWARLKGFSGSVSDIIANEFGSGYMVVTIKSSDRGFESTGCDHWSSDLSQVTHSDTSFGEGILIVGVDIKPGTYRSSEGDGCYWARLKGFTGTIRDVIANDFRTSGHGTVTIKKSDRGFKSSGCGVWTRQ